MSTRTDSFFQHVGKTFPLPGEYPVPYYFHMSKDKNHTGEIYFSNGEASEGRYLEPSFHANWSGTHVQLGDNVYANFNDCGIDPSLL